MAEGPTNNSPPRTRRSSFAGQTFADIFGTGRPSMSRSQMDSGNGSPTQNAGPITAAAAQAQRRRLSLTTVGLGNANGQASSLNSLRGRQDSLASSGGSIDECAVEDEQGPKDGSMPATPFARRVSFGARAMMDMRNSGQGSPNQQNGRSPPASVESSKSNGRGGGDDSAKAPSAGTISARDAKGRGLSSPDDPSSTITSSSHLCDAFHLPYYLTSLPCTFALLFDFTLQMLTSGGMTGSGEGFNWSDNFRNRAERTSNAGLVGGVNGMPMSSHQRAKSVAIMEPPIRETPKEQKRPDHFQERILKGDFYMD